MPVENNKKSKKKRKAKTAFVSDGLTNIMSGLGTASDKGSFSAFVKKDRSYDEFSAMYVSTAIARKIVDIIPGDMVREWRSFEDTDLKPNEIEQYTKEEQRLGLKAKVKEAMIWARLYGGALIVPIIENGDDDLSKPLDPNSIKKGSLKGFTVVDAKFAHASSRVTLDPTKKNYLMPEFYRLTTSAGLNIHHTRVIRFDGMLLPRDEFTLNRYWHQSVLDSVYNEMTNATLVSDSLAALMHELNLDIINVKGLSNAMAANQEDKIKARFETYMFIKSMFHTAVLDEDETFSNRVMPASGTADLIEKFYGLLAAVTDIPATRFLGQAPGGLNATGDSDLRNYYDNIKDKQETILLENMWTLDTIISRSLWGDDKDAVHDYKWNPLWQVSEVDQATIDLSDAQRDTLYLTNGVVTEAQIAEELMQNKVYSNITPEYVKELQDIIEGRDDDDFDPRTGASATASAGETSGKKSSGENSPEDNFGK